MGLISSFNTPYLLKTKYINLKIRSEARSFNVFAVEHLALQREAEGAACANFSTDLDFAA